MPRKKRMKLSEWREFAAKRNADQVAANRAALKAGPQTRALPRIGIDPAFREDGMGVCVLQDRRALFPKIEGFLHLQEWLRDQAPRPARIIIENSNLQNASFDLRGNRSVIAKKARNVGTNQAVSQLIVDFCRQLFGTAHVIEVSPQQKGSKWCQRTALAVAATNGHELPKRLSQDKRDAYALAQFSLPSSAV